MLVPPVLVKTTSTGYRIYRYYTGDPAYVDKGPPPLLLRLLGPFVIATTFLVIASGVALLLEPHSHVLSLAHKASFVLWFGAMAIHVLGHFLETPRLAGADYGRRVAAGRPGRGLAPPPAGRRAGQRRAAGDLVDLVDRHRLVVQARRLIPSHRLGVSRREHGAERKHGGHHPQEGDQRHRHHAHQRPGLVAADGSLQRRIGRPRPVEVVEPIDPGQVGHDLVGRGVAIPGASAQGPRHHHVEAGRQVGTATAGHPRIVTEVRGHGCERIGSRDRHGPGGRLVGHNAPAVEVARRAAVGPAPVRGSGTRACPRSGWAARRASAVPGRDRRGVAAPKSPSLSEPVAVT